MSTDTERAELIRRLEDCDLANPRNLVRMEAAKLLAADKAGGEVYPPDGTVAPFTVINLGHGKVQMGDSIHDDRLPALWFGKEGKGIGHVEELNRCAKEGETIAVVTFSNVEGLDVLLDVIFRIRGASFQNAPSYTHQQPAQQPLTEDEAIALCKTGPVSAPDGAVTRLPLEYRRELEDAMRLGLRLGEAAHGIWKP